MLTGLSTIGKRDWKPGKLRFKHSITKNLDHSLHVREIKSTVCTCIRTKRRKEEEEEEETMFIWRASRGKNDSYRIRKIRLSLKRGQCVLEHFPRDCTSFRSSRPVYIFFFTSFLSFFLTFVVCLENFIASRSSRLPIRQSSIENIYVYYMRTNHLIIIELFAHITAREGFKT